MTNDEMIADLKPFITTSMQQQLAEFELKIDEKNRARTEEICLCCTYWAQVV